MQWSRTRSRCITDTGLLGVLGRLKGCIKLCLGLQRCILGRFSRDSVRGIMGYGEGESPPVGDLQECYFTTVEYLETGVKISRHQLWFDTATSPFLQIGSDSSASLRGKTAVNLGYRQHETNLTQSLIFMVTFAGICSGVTAWLLIIIPSPWDWVRILAISVFHFGLFFLSSAPLWHEWQFRQPGRHINSDRWRALFSGAVPENRQPLHFLQASVHGGDVLHPQGSDAVISSLTFRTLGFIAVVLTAVGYLCQYAVLQRASTHQAVIWLSCQAAAAIIRALYWVLDPVFDDPKTSKAECAIFQNNRHMYLSLVEVAFALPTGVTIFQSETWEYLLHTPLVDICELIKESLEVPPLLDVEDTELLDRLDFRRILCHRSPVYIPSGHDSESTHGPHWRLALSSTKPRKLSPLLKVPYYTNTDQNLGWFQHINPKHTSCPHHQGITVCGGRPTPIVKFNYKQVESTELPRRSADRCQNCNAAASFVDERATSNLIQAHTGLGWLLHIRLQRDLFHQGPVGAETQQIWIMASSRMRARNGVVVGHSGAMVESFDSMSFDEAVAGVAIYLQSHTFSGMLHFLIDYVRRRSRVLLAHKTGDVELANSATQQLR